MDYQIAYLNVSAIVSVSQNAVCSFFLIFVLCRRSISFESITYYSGLQQLSFGVLLIVAVIVVCFSLINLVNTTITNFLSRRQETGMLQAIGLSKKQLIKMLCYEGSIYSVFATLVTLTLGTGLGFLSVQVVVKTMNPYFCYSFPWLVVLIYSAILLIVQFILISYTTGNLKKRSLIEQIRAME